MPMVPGSFKSTINLGTRYVPAPKPYQAGINQFLRNVIPGASFWVDEPPTGMAGGALGRGAGFIPYAGGAVIQPQLAAEAARQKQGQMVPVPPKANWFQNLLTSLGAALSYVPGGVGGGAMQAAKAGVGGLQGLMAAPSMVGSSWEQMLGGVAGTAARGLTDRTGVMRSMAREPMAQWETPFPVDPAWRTRDWGRAPAIQGSNPFAHPDTGVLPAWAGGPSTWNQPAESWWIPTEEQRPAASP